MCMLNHLTLILILRLEDLQVDYLSLKKVSVLATCTSAGRSAAWADKKLRSNGKSSWLRSFQDRTISNATVVLDLIDAIEPGVIDIQLAKDENYENGKMESAKYAITCGRKIGATIYAFPEDIVEVKSKMVMTVFACLIAQDCKMEGPM